MIFIDLVVLLENREFLQRLRLCVDPLRGKIDLVLAPDHAAAHIFSKKVLDLLELPSERRIICDQNALADLPKAKKSLLRSAKAILFIDDVAITGTRLRAFENSLYKHKFLDGNTEFHCLVGVARPYNKRKLRGIIHMTHADANFRAVDEILLPDWGSDKCPWCWEFEKLDALREAEDISEVSPLLKQRYDELRDKKNGIRSYPFLYWRNPEDRLELAPNSHFGEDLNAVELFASVASALQYMRSGDDTKGINGRTPTLSEYPISPVTRVLSPDLTIDVGYHDYIIKACLLRAAQRHDLSAPQTDQRLVDTAIGLLQDADATELTSELLLAMAQGKIPIVQELPNLLEARSGEPSVETFLTTLLGYKS